jgi:hypothetical protein
VKVLFLNLVLNFLDSKLEEMRLWTKWHNKFSEFEFVCVCSRWKSRNQYTHTHTLLCASRDWLSSIPRYHEITRVWFVSDVTTRISMFREEPDERQVGLSRKYYVHPVKGQYFGWHIIPMRCLLVNADIIITHPVPRYPFTKRNILTVYDKQIQKQNYSGIRLYRQLHFIYV